MPQVGAGAVAVVPTFKGFRRAVDSEVDGAAKSADRGFRRVLSKTGDDSGKEAGRGFKRSFESQSTGFANKGARELEQAIAKSARALSQSRLQEQDAAGKVRLAEVQLAEARKKYAADSSQVVRAEERLATANRQVQSAQEKTKASTQDLRAAQTRLAEAADDAGDKFVSSWRRANDRVGDVFKGSFLGTAAANLVTGLGANLGRAIGDGLRQGLDFALGTIDIASDLNESVNAVRVSYGDVADQVLRLGDDSVNAFGLSKRNLNGFATQFSAFARTIRSDNPAGFLEELITRGADFASVYNLEVGDALSLFQSGIAGETEPLRRFGIDLSAAAVEAYAYASGMAETGTELTEAQKQQARYAYLLAQTDGVAGDWINTFDSFANTQKRNAETWDDLQAKIGDGFLPIASAVASILADEVFPAISELVDKHGPELTAVFQDAIPAFSELAEELLPKLPGLFESVAESLPGILDFLTTAVPPFIDFIGSLSNGALQIKEFIDGAVANFQNGAEQWGAFLEPFADPEVWSNWANGADQINDFFTGLGENLENGSGQLDTFFEDMGMKLENGGTQWGDFFEGFGANLSNGADQWAGFGQWVADVWNGLIANFANGGSQIGSFFGFFGGALANGASQISSFFGFVGAAFSNGAGQIGSFAATVGQKINEAVGFVGSLPSRATEALTGLGTLLLSSGRALIQGFIDGITDRIGDVGDAVGSVVDWARGFFPNSPAKRGPLSGAGWTSLKESGGAVLEQWTSGFGRPDLTGVLAPAFSLVGAPSVATSAGSPGGGAMPTSFVLVDKDGQFISRVRVEASQVVRDSQQQTAVSLSNGEASR
jgi:phage-related protein